MKKNKYVDTSKLSVREIDRKVAKDMVVPEVMKIKVYNNKTGV